MDEPPRPPSVPTPPPAPPDAGHIPFTEEFDRAKWTLPPLPILGVGLAIFALALVVVMWFGRYQPAVSGTVSDVFAVEQVGGEAVLLTAQVTVRNDTDKALFIKQIKGELRADNRTLADDAAATSDFERYFTGYPDLRPHATAPLKNETRIAPHQQVSGTVVFGFPVTKQQFDARQELKVIVVPYDRREVPISEKR